MREQAPSGDTRGLGRRPALVVDRSGELRRALISQAEQAHVLLDRSPLPYGASSPIGWLSAVDRWRVSTGRLISARFPPEVGGEFALAVSTAEQRLSPARTVRAERRAIRNGIEMLEALYATQMGRISAAVGESTASARLPRLPLPEPVPVPSGSTTRR
jgi:hypothetical protein